MSIWRSTKVNLGFDGGEIRDFGKETKEILEIWNKIKNDKD